MNTMLVLSFTLFTKSPHIQWVHHAFVDLRQHVSEAGALSQYFGYMMTTRQGALNRLRHEICWAIRMSYSHMTFTR